MWISKKKYDDLLNRVGCAEFASYYWHNAWADNYTVSQRNAIARNRADHQLTAAESALREKEDVIEELQSELYQDHLRSQAILKALRS